MKHWPCWSPDTTRRGGQAFGLSSALASAMLKMADSLPEGSWDTAARTVQRLLIDPEIDLRPSRLVTGDAPDTILAEVRHAVPAGHALRILHARPTSGSLRTSHRAAPGAPPTSDRHARSYS